MINSGFIEHPQLSTPFPSNRRHWVCPIIDVKVPKWKEENLKWRAELLKRAENDYVMQQELLAASKQSVLFWVNAFVYTYHQFETNPETGKQVPSNEPHWPFITWEIQDELFNWLDQRFTEGEDGLIDKSREMGASWSCLTYLHWLWLFRPDTEIREMSRVEGLVDSSIAKSLYFKHDYINSRLPHWMCPPGVLERGKDNRTKMRIHNELNGSTIAGESTQKHAMRADRAAILLLDEFAAVDDGTAIRTSTADVAPCRIVNSTTLGAGTEYSRWKNSGQIKVFSLMFWNHPEKGKGRFVLQDEVTKEYQISSPWLEKQRERRTPREIATEVLGQDLEAGDVFFTLSLIDKHIAIHAREPKERYNIDLKGKIPNDLIPQLLRQRDSKPYSIKKTKDGKLAVWGQLIDDRPDQSKTYMFGIDVSKGQGASESVVSIKCKQTGEIIAQWACRNTPPYELVRVVIALALWCGGANPQRLPFINFELNGPGWDFGRLVVKEFHYPYYYRSETIGRVSDKKTGKYGFHVNRESKELLLRSFERALMQNKIIIHDKRTLEQSKYYIYQPSGGIGPADLTDKTAAEKLLHGDRVMSAALCVDDKEVAKPKKNQKAAPHGSWGARYEMWQKKKQQKNKGWRQPYDLT